ncbi:MAG: sigma-70 family RNA polymerase sigma factor [Chitinophagaceae bacterium]
MNNPNHTKTTAIQLDAIKSNDEPTLKNIYVAHYKKIERYVIQNSGTVAHAKDIYQEAFIVLWRNIQMDKFTAIDDDTIGNYLFTVAKNKWIDHLRKDAFKKTTFYENKHEMLMTFEDSIDYTNERIAAVKEKFKQLGSECQKLLERFYYKKEALNTIATAFGWTEATAKNNKYRCMEKLRKLVKKKKGK